MMYKRVNELLGTNFKKNSDIDWFDICCDYKLSEDFIRKFGDEIEWGVVSIYQTLSESFIREFKDEVDWGLISQYQLLSWSFILEFKNKVDWRYISTYQPFISPNYEKINKEMIEYNKLYHLYQETKKVGWFWGYIDEESKTFSIRSNLSRTKSRIYWKDLISIDKVRSFEPIRRIKYV